MDFFLSWSYIVILNRLVIRFHSRQSIQQMIGSWRNLIAIDIELKYPNNFISIMDICQMIILHVLIYFHITKYLSRLLYNYLLYICCTWLSWYCSNVISLVVVLKFGEWDTSLVSFVI